MIRSILSEGRFYRRRKFCSLCRSNDADVFRRYLIADYERQNFSLSQCTFDAGAKSDIVTIQSVADATSAANEPSNTSEASNKTGSKSGISGGAIGGIVVAAVTIIAGLIGLAFFLRKKRKWPFNLPPTELDGSSKDT